MSVENGERLVTKQDLADFYNDIRPYMGGLVTSKAGFTPIGTIISVMGTTAPVNYLACDGTVYNIADYTELANYFNEQFGSKNFFGGDGTTTFAVPDLRGEFLRGSGTNSHTNQGSGADVGVHQNGTSVFGMYKDANTLQICANNSSYVGGASEVDAVTTTSTPWIVLNKSTTSGNEARSGKVRPTNTSVLYCIATKNFYIDPTLDYSTEEKIVGTWIDGKPIYQKTYTGTSTTAIEQDLFTVADANEIISLGGRIYDNGYTFSLNYAQGTTNYYAIFSYNNIIKFRKQNNLTQNYVITIQYTKTD